MDLVSTMWETILPQDVLVDKSQSLKSTRLSDSSQKRYSSDFQSFWNYYTAKNDQQSQEIDQLNDKKKNISKQSTSSSTHNDSLLSDKLMEKIILMMVPMNVENSETRMQRLSVQSTRPSLSMNLMSTNATLLTLRLSYTFQCIDAVTIFFSWTEPTYTIAVLLVATHLILKPQLLLAIPCFYLMANVLVPHYMIRHPPDNSLKEILGRNPIPAGGDPLRPCSLPKPVPQFSQEFLLNLTDLQNHQLDFVIVYDFVVWLTKDYLYFKDENVSSLLYIILLCTLAYNVLVLPRVLQFMWAYLPIKLVLIVLTWVFTFMFHPAVKNNLLNLIFDENTRIAVVSNNNRLETYLIKVLFQEETRKAETREVEVFELQRLLFKTNIWEPLGFTNEVFTINNPTRKTTSDILRAINDKDDNDNEQDEADEEQHESEEENEDEATILSHISHCSDLNSVGPPLGWRFESNWSLDLWPTKWASNRIIEDVVNIDGDEKWVYDAPLDSHSMYRRRRWTRLCSRVIRT